MKAIYYKEQGRADEVLVLGEVATPDPGPGEVLVRVHASGVNPSDVKLRSGARPGGMPFPLIIPHSDGAGEVVAVGGGVDATRIGQRVWLWNASWQRAEGTAAEFVALPEAQAVLLPETASFAVGANLGIPAMTAAHVVFQGGGQDSAILVNGANGTVGRLAVQFAAQSGARVIATTSDLKATERLKDYGAAAVLDYRDPDIAAQVLSANGGAPVSRITEVELGANIALDAEVIAPGGRIVAFGSQLDMTPEIPFGQLMFKNVTLVAAIVYLLSDADRKAAIGRITDALENGALDVPIGAELPLQDCAKAHDLVETGARDGGVVLTL